MNMLQPGRGNAGLPVIETDRLHLRELVLDDAPFMLGLLNEPSFIANIGDKRVRTLDDARGYLATGPIASYAEHGFGIWLVTVKDGGVPVGTCGLIRREFLEDVDIGYAFLPQFSGKGYALEAATAAMACARERFGLERIIAVVNGSNARSIRLLEKLGFRYARMVRMPGEEKEIQLLENVPDR